MVAMQQSTLLQRSEKMKEGNIGAFQKIKNSANHLKCDEIGEFYKIKAIENEIKLIGEKDSESSKVSTLTLLC